MPVKAELATPDSYYGRHDRGVDKSRRVLLPSEWRLEGSATEFMMLSWPLEGPTHLLVLPPQRFSLMRQNLAGLSLTNAAAALAERLISFNSFPRSLDAYGRLPLPEAAAKAVGIVGEAVLVGRLDKFEIWSPDGLRAVMEHPDTLKMLSTLSNLQL
jgi:DNA-binding transcriptional regulator/RsmH inhibitor MraZ